MLGTLAQFQTVLLIVCGAIGSLECVLEVQSVGGTFLLEQLIMYRFPSCSIEYTLFSLVYAGIVWLT